MQISNAKSMRTFSNMGVERFWVAIGHRIEGTARRYAYAYAIACPSGNHRLHYFEKKTRTVLDGTAILVGSLVTAVLKKLVDQIAISRVYFDAIEASRSCAFDGFAILFDNASDLRPFKSPMW
jgi:hypothetical protein